MTAVLEVAAWPPPRFSPPLSVDHESLWRRYEAVFQIAWRSAMGYALDEAQCALLHAVTELRADGRLRYRQVLISMARQNGKTEIAAALGLLWLLWKAAPFVVGIASSAEQARLVYDRTMTVIRLNQALAGRFARLTDTRGIRSKTGGRYEIKPAKSAALQGLPVDLGMVDEVHLVPLALWTDLVNGTGGREDCIIVGITTAGDEDSELLKHLYKLADTGEAGEAFGHFIWESPEPRIPEDDETLARYLALASPGVASGRRDVVTLIEMVRTMPATDALRYQLNRFVARSSSFIAADVWLATARGAGEAFPEGRVVFAVDRTPGQEYATITANLKVGSVTFSEVVASLTNPTLERLLDVCVRLAKYSPTEYVMDGYGLRDLGNELKKRGLPVWIASQGDVINASSLLYAKVVRRELRHAGDPLLSVQMPRTVRKNIGDRFRISKADSSVEIDAVMSTALGVYRAEVALDTPIPIH